MSAVGRRWSRLVLVADAARRQGPAWVVFRARYAVRRRLGLLRRASPPAAWPDPDPPPAGWPTTPVDRDRLQRALVASYDAGDLDRLRARCADVRSMTFEVFGETITLSSWHDDPGTARRYADDVHWSDVRVPPGADVKRVWEPSRFGWAYDLARLHLLDPAAGAADVFWSTVDDWSRANPPNRGINWGCGQEASIRLMACVLAAGAMSDTLDADRRRLLARLVRVTGERVEANIDYARSQRNNHHASEAAGLLTCSFLDRDEERARRWRDLGERHLAEVCGRLVFPDGGTSQYSTNYHRVFLHDLVWAAAMYRAAGEAVPDRLTAAGERATRFLRTLVDPVSGRAPFFGADDGARILPLTNAPHRSVVADVALGGASFDVGVVSAGDAEPGAWLGLDTTTSALPPPVREPGRAWVESFADIGVFVIGRDDVRVFVRATDFRHRPSHDDQLHVDVWSGGRNLVRDAGTASYHPLAGHPGMLDTADFHNGPRLPARPGLRRASTFLWAGWTTARCRDLVADGSTARGRFELELDGVVVERTVELGADEVVVTDRSDEPLVSTWQLADGTDASFDREVEWETKPTSDGYGTSCDVAYATVRADGGPDQVVTTIRI